MNNFDFNILIGSILGDGTLGLYGRSKNAYYREHFSNKQLHYRKWKHIHFKDICISLKTTSNSSHLY